MGRLSPDGVTPAEPLPEILLLDGDRCDAACPAQAQVHVTRYPDRELAFCGHHFHQHALALMTSGWQPVGLGTADASESAADGGRVPL